MLPIHEKEDGSKSFNVSKHQKGKDYFRGFQDRFYDHMRERYPDKDLQRTDPNRDHTKKLSVREYKENQDFKRELEHEHQRLVLVDTFNNEILAHQATPIQGSTKPYYHCLEQLKLLAGKKNEEQTPQVVLHTDQGSVYSSQAFRQAHEHYNIWVLPW